MSEEKAVEPTENKLLDALAAFEDSPTQEVIDGWKGMHGDVYVSAFTGEEIFIFRSLNRQEFGKLQTEAAEQQVDAFEYEKNTVKQCLLWQSVSDLEAKAGTIPSLLEMIMQNSNFVPPAVASQLVAKL